MPTTVSLHQLSDLTKAEEKNEIFLQTDDYTELSIKKVAETTIISFPFGNKFDVIGGKIYVYEINEK